jgi:DNA invertase Pin-like site-specific DNA recombinase
VLGYARVSTGDQDVAGQTMRLERAAGVTHEISLPSAWP